MGKDQVKDRSILIDKIKKALYKKTKFYVIKGTGRDEIWAYDEGVYKPNGINLILKTTGEFLGIHYRRPIAEQVADIIVQENICDPLEFFNSISPGEICVKNGILNLKTRKLSKHTPNKIFFNKFNINYNPKAKCPNFITFVDSIIEDDGDRRVIQELFGDVLWTEYKWEKCHMWLGSGRNGKSKLGEVLRDFIGHHNVCAIHPGMLQDPGSTVISHFYGKMVNLALDVNDNDLKNVAILKSLSGRDKLTANRKYLEPISFVNYAKLVFGCNSLPRVADSSDGSMALWERFILIEFPYTFVDKDTLKLKKSQGKKNYKLQNPGILDNIKTEKEFEGILNYALDGLERLIKNKKYSYKYNSKQVASIWISKSDPLRSFFIQYIEMDYDSKIQKNDFRMAYAQFCRKHKLKIYSEKKTNYFMETEGVLSGRLQNDLIDAHTWDGIRFKPEMGGMTGIEKTSILSKDNIDLSNYKIKDGQMRFR